VLRYLPHVEIKVVEGDEHNMKVTQPVDVFLADKLFQLAWASVRRLETTDEYVQQLRGRTAVIFGGSSGIGESLVHSLRNFGVDVFSFSRSETGTHVENSKHVEMALRTTYEETGRIDYVVNTAGMLQTGALIDADEATVEDMIQVNYVAPVTIARRAFRFLRLTHGHLLLFTSSSYTRGRAGYSLYSSSKAAVVNLTQALADEWVPYGVRASCINPERTATPMRLRAFGEEPADSLLTSLQVAMTSIDVLISDITGQVVDVRRIELERPAGPLGLDRTPGNQLPVPSLENRAHAATEGP
jgi:2-C-methyl-D-erythritol 4-phosphate cytidylyltransferase